MAAHSTTSIATVFIFVVLLVTSSVGTARRNARKKSAFAKSNRDHEPTGEEPDED